MRTLSVVIALLLLSSIACRNAEAPPGGASPGAAPGSTTSTGAGMPTGQPSGTLAEVMRGILFPNSNIIFDTQSTDPAAEKKESTGASATERFSSVYPGWERVVYAANAIAESPNLILLPGRKCQNGKPVPIDQPDFQKYALALRDVGLNAVKAAQSKSQDAMVDISGQVADACAACHEIYRDVGTADSPARCTPPAAAQKKPS